MISYNMSDLNANGFWVLQHLSSPVISCLNILLSAYKLGKGFLWSTPEKSTVVYISVNMNTVQCLNNSAIKALTNEQEVRSHSCILPPPTSLMFVYPDLTCVVVFRIQQQAEFRKKLWPVLQLSLGGNSGDEDTCLRNKLQL